MYMRIYTKTIFHEKTKKKGYAQWLHPDMVGVYFPIDEWREEVLDFSREFGSPIIKLYSFEIKRELGFHNLRESFFQTVSNSSWANEGYVVAASIEGSEEFSLELKRLSTSFGIGVIRLNIEDPDSSKIEYPAKYKEILDWDTINKLADENPDFKKFLVRVRKDLHSKEIRVEKYDKLYSSDELLKRISKFITQSDAK